MKADTPNVGRSIFLMKGSEEQENIYREGGILK